MTIFKGVSIWEKFGRWRAHSHAHHQVVTEQREAASERPCGGAAAITVKRRKNGDWGRRKRWGTVICGVGWWFLGEGEGRWWWAGAFWFLLFSFFFLILRDRTREMQEKLTGRLVVCCSYSFHRTWDRVRVRMHIASKRKTDKAPGRFIYIKKTTTHTKPWDCLPVSKVVYEARELPRLLLNRRIWYMGLARGLYCSEKRDLIDCSGNKDTDWSLGQLISGLELRDLERWGGRVADFNLLRPSLFMIGVCTLRS